MAGTRTIQQTATICGATPADIYGVLMDSKKHSSLSGQKTTVSPKVCGGFTVGRDLEGTRLELVKNKRIKQTWRANNWPVGVYSKATFTLSKAPGGARIAFRQSGVPSRYEREIAAGWRSYYWQPLRARSAAAER